jgi:uncharacterized membrane protein YphA (DoxX/SURF4 family)
MTTALWSVQIILAVIFAIAGFTKVSQPREKLVASLTWTEDYPLGFVRMIGLLEVLAAVGLILPLVTGVLPVLTPVAAAGLAIIMIGAIVVHVRRGESSYIPMNVGLLLAAAFVAVGRFVLGY